MRHLKIAALVVLLTGLASSATAGDVFYACSNNHTSKLRASTLLANATPACKPTETLRTWSETGPQGPAGPSDAFSAFADETPLPAGGTFLPLAQLSLPAGSYVITAKGSLSNSNAAVTAFAYCAIIVGSGPFGLNNQTLATINGIGTVAVSAMLPITLPAADVVGFRCTNNTNSAADGDLTAQMVTMAAIHVATLTEQ